MFPWTHFGFGYALFVLVVLARRVRGTRSRRSGVARAVNSRAELLALAVGTQLPDLIDKPLAWALLVLPGGRSMAHSLVFAVPLVALGWLLARRWAHPEVAGAFALGYASHLVGDVYIAVAFWRTEEFTFLLWPLFPAYPYDEGFAGFLTGFTLSRPVLAGLLAGGLLGCLFLLHLGRLPWVRRAA